MKLGFNISIDGAPVETIKTEIDAYSHISNEAIELSLTKINGILEFPFEKIYKNLRKFKYISVHLPVVVLDKNNNKVFLEYPNPNLIKEINIIKNIAKDLNINTFIIHPDQVKDFDWANEEFGELLGFENMDNQKNFGKNISDMKKVFDNCNQAKWIFDVNHLFTNDPAMNSASEFYKEFKTRLTHYHISAFGGFHSSFSKNPNEIKILDGVIDLSFPMIHEGFDFVDGNLNEEYDLIINTLNNK